MKKRLRKKLLKREEERGEIVTIPVDDLNVFYDKNGMPLKDPQVGPVKGVTIGCGNLAESFDILPNPDRDGLTVVRYVGCEKKSVEENQ